MTVNVAASVKARLLNQAREAGDELELFLVRYASERFLFRLGASPLRDRYVLKGAALLTLWVDDVYRATRDIDLLGSGASDPASLRQVVETICRVECPEDGLRFDTEGIVVTPIRAEDKYPGQRAVLTAYLGKARIRLQVDFGFGDPVTPAAELTDYPTLLAELPPPRLRTYPVVATVAEKFDAMVQLGRRNSRMKDFHDVWALSGELPFDGPVLYQAVADCFARRGTDWSGETPDALGSMFYGDESLQSRWRAYVRAGAFRNPPPADFEEVGERVRSFLGPVRESLVAQTALEVVWPPGGPWQ